MSYFPNNQGQQGFDRFQPPQHQQQHPQLGQRPQQPDMRMVGQRPPMDPRYMDSSMDNRYRNQGPPPGRPYDNRPPSDPRMGMNQGMGMGMGMNQPRLDQRIAPSFSPGGLAPGLNNQNNLAQQQQPNIGHGLSSLNPNPIGLRPTLGQSLLQAYSRPSVSELVQVPPELAGFAAEPKFQQILLRVKEQTNVNFITLNRVSENFVESVAIDASSKESAELARNLIETHLKLQMKIKAAENRLQKVQTDLFSTQGEIAAGHMVEFVIRSELIGLAIGKKGARIKQVESETGISSINVGDNGHIMIYGPDAQSVQKAREQLELFEDAFPLNETQAEWLSDKFNASVIADLRTGSNLMVAKVNRDTNELEVVGTMSSVQMAKFLLSTQLEYVDKQIEIEMSEREARDKLNAVRKQYGLNSAQWKNKVTSKSNHANGSNNNNNNNNNNSNNQRDNVVVAAPAGPTVTTITMTGNGTHETRLLRDNHVDSLLKMNQPKGRDVRPTDEKKNMDDALNALIGSGPAADTANDNTKKRGQQQQQQQQSQQPMSRGRTNDRNQSSDPLIDLVAAKARHPELEIHEPSRSNKNDNRGQKVEQKNSPAKQQQQKPAAGNANPVNANGGRKVEVVSTQEKDKSGNQKAQVQSQQNQGKGPERNDKKASEQKVQESAKATQGQDKKNNDNKQQQGKQKIQESKPQEKSDKQQGKNNNNKDNRNQGQNQSTNVNEMKKNSGAEGPTLVVIPPAPNLVVPPPPPSAQGKVDAKDANNKKKGVDKRQETKESSQPVQQDSKKDKQDKQPMLMKINNPFLEQQQSKKASEAELVPSLPEPPSHKVSGPPKEAPANIATAKKDDKKPTKTDSEPSNNNEKRHNNSNNPRPRRDNADLLNKVEIISVVTVDHKLAENLSVLKLENASGGGKGISASSVDEDKNQDKRKVKKVGKANEESAEPVSGSNTEKVDNTVDAKPVDVVKSEESLPKKTTTTTKKPTDKKETEGETDTKKDVEVKEEVKKPSSSPPPGIPSPVNKPTAAIIVEEGK